MDMVEFCDFSEETIKREEFNQWRIKFLQKNTLNKITEETPEVKEAWRMVRGFNFGPLEI